MSKDVIDMLLALIAFIVVIFIPASAVVAGRILMYSKEQTGLLREIRDRLAAKKE